MVKWYNIDNYKECDNMRVAISVNVNPKKVIGYKLIDAYN